jgi:carboxyl-terminal processing protease
LAADLRRTPVAFAFILVACAGSGGVDDARALDQTGKLFAKSYEQVDDLYLDPVPAGAVAASAMQRLSVIDDRLSVLRHADAIELRYDGATVARHARPDDFDSAAWGALTSDVVKEAKSASAEIAGTAEEKLHQTLFDGMIANLDRFSRYAAPEAARDQRAARDGFGGIGVTLDYMDNEVRVTSVIPESPAHRAGLQVDDRIASIDGTATAELTRTDVIRRLRGPVDSRVQVTVARPGRPKPIAFAVTRGFIVVPTVTTSTEAGGIAVFRIASFNHQTTQNLADQVAAARRQMGASLKGVVLDLRGNPGGLLDQSVAVADLFMTGGPIVSTRGRNPDSMQFYKAAPDDILRGLPIVALVNGGSASAAEIVAAALQDSGRAVVVGSASYGKGTVQTVLRLPNDGELTLTWAKLISPAGYVLHEHGVVPNVCTSGIGENENEIGAALSRGTTLAAGTVAARARKSLDEPGWSDLRKTCPAEMTEHKAEIEIAKRLIVSPNLYARALHPEPAAVATRTAPILH